MTPHLGTTHTSISISHAFKRERMALTPLQRPFPSVLHALVMRVSHTASFRCSAQESEASLRDAAYASEGICTGYTRREE